MVTVYPAGQTETAAQSPATPNDKVNEQATKKKRKTDTDGHTGNSDKDKKPRATDATKKADNTGTSTVQEPSPPKRTKQKATSVESAPDKKPAATNETTGVATQEQARTNPVTAPQAEPISTGAEKTESSDKPAPATVAPEDAANKPNVEK